jgi:hypothetical protein
MTANETLFEIKLDDGAELDINRGNLSRSRVWYRGGAYLFVFFAYKKKLLNSVFANLETSPINHKPNEGDKAVN